MHVIPPRLSHIPICPYLCIASAVGLRPCHDAPGGGEGEEGAENGFGEGGWRSKGGSGRTTEGDTENPSVAPGEDLNFRPQKFCWDFLCRPGNLLREKGSVI